MIFLRKRIIHERGLYVSQLIYDQLNTSFLMFDLNYTFDRKKVQISHRSHLNVQLI